MLAGESLSRLRYPIDSNMGNCEITTVQYKTLKENSFYRSYQEARIGKFRLIRLSFTQNGAGHPKRLIVSLFVGSV